MQRYKDLRTLLREATLTALGEQSIK
jgi:hypothetical protein